MEFTKTEMERFGKAKELQADWKPQVGDWFYKAKFLGQGTWLICRILGATLWCSGKGMTRPEFGNRLVEFMAPENYTWIPSIEQMLEMVWKGWNDIAKMHLLCELKDLAQVHYDKAGLFPSMKLLVLTFVMRGRYQRRWDGKTWRKLTESKAEK